MPAGGSSGHCQSLSGPTCHEHAEVTCLCLCPSVQVRKGHRDCSRDCPLSLRALVDDALLLSSILAYDVSRDQWPINWSINLAGNYVTLLYFFPMMGIFHSTLCSALKLSVVDYYGLHTFKRAKEIPKPDWLRLLLSERNFCWPSGQPVSVGSQFPGKESDLWPSADCSLKALSLKGFFFVKGSLMILFQSIVVWVAI